MGWAVIFIGMVVATFAVASVIAWVALAVQRFYRLYEREHGIHFPDPFNLSETRRLDVMFDRRRRDREWAAVFQQRYPDGELEAARQLIVRRLTIGLIIVGSVIGVVASLAFVADQFGGFETAMRPARLPSMGTALVRSTDVEQTSADRLEVGVLDGGVEGGDLGVAGRFEPFELFVEVG